MIKGWEDFFPGLQKTTFLLTRFTLPETQQVKNAKTLTFVCSFGLILSTKKGHVVLEDVLGSRLLLKRSPVGFLSAQPSSAASTPVSTPSPHPLPDGVELTVSRG